MSATAATREVAVGEPHQQIDAVCMPPKGAEQLPEQWLVEGDQDPHGEPWQQRRQLLNSAAVDVAANVTLLEPRDQSAGANFDNLLPRRARRIANLEIDRSVGAFRFGTTIHVEGSRFDDPANTRRLGGFTTVDLRAEYRVDKAWSIQARVENALDKRYETVAFFNQPGRGAFVTVRYQP